MIDLSLRIGEELVSNAKFVDYNDKAVAVLDSVSKEDAVIVKRGRDVVGILDKRAVGREMHGTTISKTAIVGKMARKTPVLSEESTIIEAIRYMQTARCKALPYSKGGKITGLVKRTTLLKALLSTKALRGMKVGDTMTSNFLSIHQSRSISEATAMMAKKKVNRLVTLTENGLPTVITLHDIAFSGRKPSDRKPQRMTKRISPNDAAVVELANENPIYISKEGSLEDAVRSFVMNNVSSLIVKDNKDVAGIITVYDVFESLIMADQNPTKLLITGIDEETEDYKDTLEEYAARFVDRIGKINKIKLDYLVIRFKRIKDKKYEVYARAAVPKRGTMYVHMSGFYLERTVNSALAKLKEMVMKNKEKMVVKNERPELEDEE
jgi:Predicted transcriptional regulator, contains C-terminal CBS domains